MKRKLPAILLLLCGAALLAAALILYAHNRQEDIQAGKAAADQLSKLVQPTETQSDPLPPTPADPDGTPEKAETIPTEPLSPEDCVMEEVEIDGNAYIGYLTIPEAELQLPVISQWTYDALQIAPCRYTGTMKGEDLVLLAHNYDQHFGKLDELPLDAELSFTDTEGTTYRYRVVLQETLDGADVEGMTTGDYDLSLFTCTYNGKSRFVIRCERIKP